MKHLGLFEGIGGFSLAARWMGWETIAWCEWNPFCQNVLSYHFPNATPHGDITKTDFTIYRGRVDILTGGFPCQPYSTAGKRLGTEDERHLWPEMLRAIREISPRWIVGENVHGIVNWSGGLVFEQVQTDLEAEGYEVQAYVLPACGKNAPHRRDRVWFVAYSSGCNDKRDSGKLRCEDEQEKAKRQEKRLPEFGGSDFSPSANPYGAGLQKEGAEKQSTGTPRSGMERTSSYAKRSRWLQDNQQYAPGEPKYASTSWERFPTQSPVCGGDDGIPRELDTITFPSWRSESIKAYGNAIVPQVALEIFKAIEKYEGK